MSPNEQPAADERILSPTSSRYDRDIPSVISANDYKRLVESVSDYAIFMLDPEGVVSSWNRGAERIKGYRADEIIGRHFSIFYPPEDIEAGRPAHELLESARSGRFEDEGWRLRKDGSRFWASVVTAALHDDDGRLVGFAKVTRDLSERRKIEEELRHSEGRFRLLIESVSDYAIYMLDPTGQITTWNAGAQRMKGYRADEILGRNFEIFFPEEDRLRDKPRLELEAARIEGRFEDEGWRIRSDGTRFWANVVVAAIHDANGEHRGFAKVTRDLTSHRAAEETQRNLLYAEAARVAAEKLAEQAAEANRIKDEFLATVSHELRTPLNAIVGWTKLLLQKELDASVAHGIAVIDRNAEAQAQLIDDILDVSRIITGKLRIEPLPIDLAVTTREAMDVVRPSAEAKDIKLELVQETPDCFLVGDPGRLRQVIWNLLANAVKFTAKGGTITVRLGIHQSRLVLSVTDTGRGIAPEFLPYVFDRFKQEESSTTRRFGGLGLGLALVRHIVELHGGIVEVSSVLGKGSVFTVTLPVRAVATVTPAADKAKPASSMTGMLRGFRILIVDDEPDARELVKVVLESADAQVDVAGSVREAMELLGRDRPDVVVSDIAMPEQDGYSLMRWIREQAKLTIPTIALTAYTRAEDQTEALAAGFTTHVGKPVNPEDLVRAVKNLAVLTHH